MPYDIQTADYLAKNTLKDVSKFQNNTLLQSSNLIPQSYTLDTQVMKKMQPLGISSALPGTGLQGINTKSLATGVGGAIKGTSSMGGLAQGLSAVSGTVGSLLDVVGKPIDEKTTAGKVIDTAGDTLSVIPGGVGIGLALKGVSALNRAFGKKSKTQETAGETALGYSLQFNPKAGKQYGLFGGKKRRAEDRKTAALDKENIIKMTTSRAASKELSTSITSAQDKASKNTQSLTGGINTNILAAKKGTKLQFKNIIDKVNIHAKGGTIKNVIPDGVLHARKNNLNIDGVTSKGIPVVSSEDSNITETLAKGGEITQHAEVEINEVILHIGLTKQLEELLSKFEKADNKKEKDKLSIEAGKILTKELLENTDDKTGLINTIE